MILVWRRCCVASRAELTGQGTVTHLQSVWMPVEGRWIKLKLIFYEELFYSALHANWSGRGMRTVLGESRGQRCSRPVFSCHSLMTGVWIHCTSPLDLTDTSLSLFFLLEITPRLIAVVYNVIIPSVMFMEKGKSPETDYFWFVIDAETCRWPFCCRLWMSLSWSRWSSFHPVNTAEVSYSSIRKQLNGKLSLK